MPRRLASFLAHVRASGLSRIETAWYFAGPFGGRPRRGRLVPSFFAIAFRAASVSRAVTRRAFSKGKVFALDISLPLLSIRGPRADDPIDAPRVANREDHHEDAGVGLSDQPPSFFSRRRVNCIGCDESERVVKRRDGHREADAVLRLVRGRLPGVPLELHLRYIPKQVAKCQVWWRDDGPEPSGFLGSQRVKTGRSGKLNDRDKLGESVQVFAASALPPR